MHGKRTKNKKGEDSGSQVGSVQFPASRRRCCADYNYAANGQVSLGGSRAANISNRSKTKRGDWVVDLSDGEWKADERVPSLFGQT